MSKPYLILASLIAFASGPAAAHAGHGEGAWEPEWLLIANIVVVAAVFLLADRWLRAVRPNLAPGRTGVLLWCGGMLAAAAATATPLDWYADQLFSVHMLQHTALVLLAAPLLAYAVPDRLLPQWPPAAGALIAFCLATGLFWLWHLPVLYLGALESEALHALEHLAMLLSAILFWWAFRRLSGGARVLYLFLASLSGSLLGALLTFSSDLWYPPYAESAPALGLSGLQDQQLAGLVMWIPGGLLYLLLAALSFNAWLQREPAAFAEASR